MMKANFKKGFTLIELLVVIAIISLLSSIIIASLQKGRTSAKDAARLSTLVSLRTALSLYHADYGSYPVSPVWRYSSQFPDDWIPGLSPGYISSMPQEPDSHETLCLADNPPAPDFGGTAYRYRSNGTTYKIHAHCPPVSPAMANPNHQFTHCPANGGANHAFSWSICGGPGCPNIWCGPIEDNT